MRLLYFAPPRTIHTARFLSAFVRRGHEVHFATEDPAWGASLAGVRVHPLPARFHPGRPVGALRALRAGRRILREVAPDLVHGHYVSSAGGLAGWLGFHPFVMTAWGSDVFVVPRRSPVHRWFVRRQLAGCDLYTTNSFALRDAGVALGVPPDRTALIRWGVDVARLASLRGNPALRALAGVPDGTALVLSTRWLEPLYNIETIVRAVPRVATGHGGPVCFVIAGDGSLRARLERLAAELGVAAHVRFPGRLDPAAVEACYGGADVYVTIPDTDSVSTSILEGMASALPIVASDIGSYREVLEDGVGGRLVPPKDPAAVADAILALLADPILRRRCGERNAKVAAETGDLEANMAKVEGLYRNLVAGRALETP